MEHEEFVSSLRARRVEVEVDRAKALEIANAKDVFPASYHRQHLWWTAAWLATLPVAAFAGFFVKWWAGVLVLLFVTPALFRATNKRAMRFTIDYAIENSTFYAYALDHQIIRVRSKA